MTSIKVYPGILRHNGKMAELEKPIDGFFRCMPGGIWTSTSVDGVQHVGKLQLAKAGFRSQEVVDEIKETLNAEG